ncbi:MAG: trypsin-like peptidase domain-containing protein [Bryobacter sp.]|nr:trypsin-like peptidase domain-containing protein [Bryobacter sp.]
MKRFVVLAGLLVAGFVLFTSPAKWNPLRRVQAGWMRPVSMTGGPLFAEPEKARAAGLSNDEQNNIEIYKLAHMATVNITSTVYQRGWFREMYPSKNSGSGFLINDKGYILTNNHVVSGSAQLTVTLADKRQFTATMLDRDPANDLALIKIEPKGKLSTLRLGESDNLQVGQKVLAIGNPFGLEGTLTTGIISSLGREISDENGRTLEGMIQTDAAINPGNSGGPLIDSQGNVIGINTAIYGPGGNIGLGFAMPINRAKTMLEDYGAGRKYAPPRLGVQVVHIVGDLAVALDLPREGGLLIQDVIRGSAAEAAGLRGPTKRVIVGNYELLIGGDLILEIDGKRVDRADAISRAMSRKRAGDKLELTLFRGGRTLTQTVTLGAAPERL